MTDLASSIWQELFDSMLPAFDPPVGLQAIQGYLPGDEFLSGVFPLGKYKVGFVRIPSMQPNSTLNAGNQLATDVQYLEQNTDGPLLDVMGNGGGDGRYSQTLASMLIPQTFRGLAQQEPATLRWQEAFSSARQSAIAMAQHSGLSTCTRPISKKSRPS